MTDWDGKHRRLDQPTRERSAQPPTDALPEAGPIDALRSLQQRAGNTAVASLLAGTSRGANAAPGPGGMPGVQRAPAAPAPSKDRDDLLRPDVGGSSQSVAGAGSAGAHDDAGKGSFEQDLFETSVMNPMRAVFANVRDTPPDADKALALLMPIGQALWDYENRFRGQDDALANGFYAARGWLGQTVKELQRRVGPTHTPTDQEIADRIQDSIDDLGSLQGKLR